MNPGVRLDIDVSKWRKAIERVRKLEDRQELLEAIAELGANQGKIRIRDERRSPDGVPWKPWSDEYKKTRKPQHSLLVSDGHMREGLYGEVDSEQNIILGSDMSYSVWHQEQRPFLGLSSDNAAEIERMIYNWVSTVL